MAKLGAFYLFWVVWPLSEVEEGRLDCPKLNESSGVAVSHLGSPLWSHNDSGDHARFFGFSLDGRLLAECRLRGTNAVDWEDACAFTFDGKHYLAFGDVGDNQRRRKSVQIIVVPEPNLSSAERLRKDPLEILLKPSCVLTVKYESGAFDCEAIAFDPVEEAFVLFTKESLRCQIFYAKMKGLKQDQAIEARRQHTLVLPMVTGADISRDGSKMVLTTYGPGCIIRRTTGNAWNMSDIQMIELPARRQGESICFSPDARRLFLTSEFAPTPLFQLPCPGLQDSGPQDSGPQEPSGDAPQRNR